MNKVLLVGRIASDPTARTTASNMQVSNFTVACNTSYARTNAQNSTTFVPCVELLHHHFLIIQSISSVRRWLRL